MIKLTLLTTTALIGLLTLLGATGYGIRPAGVPSVEQTDPGRLVITDPPEGADNVLSGDLRQPFNPSGNEPPGEQEMPPELWDEQPESEWQIVPVPDEDPSPSGSLHMNICNRTPTVQQTLIRWFYPNGGGFCRMITDEDLVRIQELEIAAAQIRPEDLAGLTELTRLSLTLNETPPPGAFADLSRLETLKVTTDKPWHIGTGSLDGPASLRNLRAHGSEEITIGKSGLPPTLETLELYAHQLTMADPIHLPKLDSLTVGAAEWTGPLNLAGAPDIGEVRADGNPSVIFANYEALCRAGPGGQISQFLVNGENAALIKTDWDHCIIGIGPPTPDPENWSPDTYREEIAVIR